MEYREIIDYVAIRYDKILSLFYLPVADKEIIPLRKYEYDISNCKFVPFLEKFFRKRHKERIYNPGCTIKTVFGDEYLAKIEGKGLLLPSEEKKILIIHTIDKMAVKNAYFRSDTLRQRFDFMEFL